jgi:predicted anti-sigma-YlaC factor YlaD
MDVMAQKELHMRWQAKMAVVGYIGLIVLMVIVAGSQMAASNVSHGLDHTVSQATQQDTATDHLADAPVDVIFVGTEMELFRDLR